MAKRNSKKPVISINILIGLPASGKSTFANELNCSSVATLISLDDYIKNGKLPEYNQIWKEVFKYHSFYGSTNIILDGLFLTNPSRKSVLSSLIDYIEQKKQFNGYDYKIIYHFWNEDRETCLHNDKGRRSIDSSVTIKNAPYESLNVDYIQKDFKVDVIKTQIKEHTVVHATTYNKFFQPHGHYNNPDILKSERWSLGGECCDYTGGCDIIEASPTPEFVEFDELLEKVCPNISFLQYKNIRRQCVQQKSETEYDYYGGNEENAWWECNLKVLYGILLEKGLITED